jgi:ATP-dependent Clp protease adapter protein ClpS
MNIIARCLYGGRKRNILISKEVGTATIHKSYWTTLKGDKIFPMEFETKHLKNTIKFMEKRAIPLTLQHTEVEALIFLKRSKLYTTMLKELHRRGEKL